MGKSALVLCAGLLLLPCRARADEPPPVLSPDANIEIAPRPPQPQAHAGGNAVDTAAPEPDAPPPRPHHRGLVVESGLGMIGFAGQFRHVSPPGFLLHAQLGYEPTTWLMVFGRSELALTDTSEAEGPEGRAFPIWGFGGGARGTVHWGERIGTYLQGEIGALTAIVPHGALAILGFRSAESLGLSAGARLGVEWYHRDPHLALALEIGARDAVGFARSASSDLPIMWDTGLLLRYTF